MTAPGRDHPQIAYNKALRQAIDNYRAFQGLLPSLLNTARGKWVLLHNRQTIGEPFNSWEEALDTGWSHFGHGMFSSQQIVELFGDCGDGPTSDELSGAMVRVT